MNEVLSKRGLFFEAFQDVLALQLGVEVPADTAQELVESLNICGDQFLWGGELDSFFKQLLVFVVCYAAVLKIPVKFGPRHQPEKTTRKFCDGVMNEL